IVYKILNIMISTISNLSLKDYRIFNITSELFRNTSDSNILEIMVKIYIESINHIVTEEELKRSIKDVVSMSFFEPLLIELIVKKIYQHDVEKYIQMFFKLLTYIKNGEDSNLPIACNKIKIIHLVGCIAINHSKYIDKIEKKIKESYGAYSDTGIFKRLSTSKMGNDISLLRERRRSINASRHSIRMSMINDDSMVIDTDKIKLLKRSEEENTNENISNRENNNSNTKENKNKSEEELLDILFYIKEKEIIEHGLLKDYIPLVIEECKIDNNIDNTDNSTNNNDNLINTTNIKVIAFNSLFRIMVLSSTFFINNFKLFINALSSNNDTIRYNALLAHSDYILLYNFIVEKYNYLLFDKLNDMNINIRYNSI
ncbi:Condensin complex component, partial [Spraguea lophii 42_110]